MRLDEGLTGGVEGEHGEIVRDDGVELFGLPVGSGFRSVGHGVSPEARLDALAGNARAERGTPSGWTRLDIAHWICW